MTAEKKLVKGRYFSIRGGGAARCLDLQFRAEYGTTYEITADAEGFPEASGTTTVPGALEITHAEARGNPPGTAGLDLSWRPSEGAYRYVVGLRPAETPHCFVVNSCSEEGWQLATTDTAVHVTVPADELEGYEGPWTVDVYAMDKALYQYLTTGTSGNLFPVQAVQNVEGGYGVVGSWVRRSWPLGASSADLSPP